jgi:hypothetical protein
MKNVVMRTAMNRAFAGDLAKEEAQRVILNAAITSHATASGGFIADIGAARIFKTRPIQRIFKLTRRTRRARAMT